jgi:hypothetical protein
LKIPNCTPAGCSSASSAILPAQHQNPYHDHLPWAHDAEVFEVRQALQPATVDRHLFDGLAQSLHQPAARHPILHPRHPDATPQGNWFGSELVVAPFTLPVEDDTRLAKTPLWLPEGIGLTSSPANTLPVIVARPARRLRDILSSPKRGDPRSVRWPARAEPGT